jgi:hypothetical protein
LGRGSSLLDARAHDLVYYRPFSFPDFPHAHLTYIHCSCSHNELVALRNRVLAAVPQISDRMKRDLRIVARRLGRLFPFMDKWPIERMPTLYTGLKRARYERAVDKYHSTGCTRKQSHVRLFVKAEKCTPVKVNPDPRAIQMRDPVYCVAISQFLKPIEPYLYEFEGDGRTFPEGRLFGKGLGAIERAKLLQEKMAEFKDPRVISMDFSRFDRHVQEAHLRAEHMVYLRVFRNHPELRRLLSYALLNIGKTMGGYTYVCPGGRMSGDMDTALGNCIIVLLMIAVAMKGIRYQCLIDGDDSLIIVNSDDVPHDLERKFCELGMTAKLEAAVSEMELVEWCQAKPVQIRFDEYVFIRHPWKVVSTLGITRKYMEGKARYHFILTLGYAEYLLNRGCPILQAFALMLVRTGQKAGGKLLHLDPIDEIYYRVSRELKASGLSRLDQVVLHDDPIEPIARLSFSRAFGIDIPEQYAWERHFNRIILSLSRVEGLGDEYSPGKWQSPISVGPDARLLGHYAQ